MFPVNSLTAFFPLKLFSVAQKYIFHEIKVETVHKNYNKSAKSMDFVNALYSYLFGLK